MSAISGTRRAIKELVDGTIRLQVDIDPQFRQKFFELFPHIDAPIALAPLAPGKAPMAAMPSEETDANIVEAAKGGALARLAGQLCADPLFQKWLCKSRGLTYLGLMPGAEDNAAQIIRQECDVKSRAELDHNAEAAEKFHVIRRQWQEHCAK